MALKTPRPPGPPWIEIASPPRVSVLDAFERRIEREVGGLQVGDRVRQRDADERVRDVEAAARRVHRVGGREERLGEQQLGAWAGGALKAGRQALEVVEDPCGEAAEEDRAVRVEVVAQVPVGERLARAATRRRARRCRRASRPEPASHSVTRPSRQSSPRYWRLPSATFSSERWSNLSPGSPSVPFRRSSIWIRPIRVR